MSGEFVMAGGMQMAVMFTTRRLLSVKFSTTSRSSKGSKL